MEKTQGVVIKCKDYRETSQLVWLFSRDFGKLKVIAKGSRTKSKMFKGKIDLFNLLDIVFYKSHRSELHTLSECDVIEPFVRIRQDLDRLAVASYVAELTESSTALEDPSLEVFNIILDIFKWLSEGKNPYFLRCIFELKLMHYLGNLPSMENKKDISKGTAAIVKRILGSKVFNNIKISKQQMKELNDIMRLVIDYSIGKRLKSLSFMEGLKNVPQRH